MPLRLAFTIAAMFFLADFGSACAAADAGAAGGDGATEDAPQAIEDAPSGPQPVVACDGALCDTAQGRPSCDVSGWPVSSGHNAETYPLAALIALGAYVLRRPKRGA